MNREAQKTKRLPVVQSRDHELVHAYLLHVIRDLELGLALVAEEVRDAILVGLQGLQAQAIGLVGAALHPGGADGFGVPWDRQDVPRGKALTGLRVDPIMNDFLETTCTSSS